MPTRQGHPHSCAVCEGRVRPTAFAKCPVYGKRANAEKEAEKKIRTLGLWRGRLEFRRLVSLHEHARDGLGADGRADRSLPLGLYQFASIVAHHRRVERNIADERRRAAAMAEAEAKARAARGGR